MPIMRLTLGLIFYSFAAKTVFESQLTGKIFQNYRVSLEQSSIQASGSVNYLFLSLKTIFLLLNYY